MNNNFLREIEEENRVLEEELNTLLLKQSDSLRFSFSQKKQNKFEENRDENQCPNQRVDQGDLSRIDEEMEDEQPHRYEPQRIQESPQKCDSTIDNLVDSINNYMHKRRNSSTEPQSHRASEQKRNDSAQKQIKSLEMRLSGTREAMKALEKEVKEKNLIIQNLQIELNKKNKLLDSQTKTQQSTSTYNSTSQLNTETYQDLKKQCKEWEKKFQDNEAQIKENKKYMQRLQELNAQLLFKLKHYELDKDTQHQELDEISNSLSKYETNIKNLQTQLNFEKDKHQVTLQKYDELKLSCDQFIENSRDLKIQYEHMLNTLQQLANSF